MTELEDTIMKMRILLTAIVLGIAGTATAATLSNLSGQSCGASTGTWHFVNNQTRGAAPGMLGAEWSSGNTCTMVSPSAVNRNVQHFYCTAAGTLLDAETNLPGRLVLSDLTCVEPPKCDPKYDKDCKYE